MTDENTEGTAPAADEAGPSTEELAQRRQSSAEAVRKFAANAEYKRGDDKGEGHGDEEHPGASQGLKADLAKERERRRQAEGRVGELESVQSQLDAITKALGMSQEDEAPDPAKITAELEESRRVAAENAAALVRYKTAVEKQVPSHLVEFVTGSTAEEVEASIEKVLAAFGASKPSGPRPDPSQGVQGAPASLDAQIAAAEQAGNTREVIRLKARKTLPTN